MRNLKKVLSLSLALVMLLGMMVVGAGAANYTDAADVSNNRVEAVEVMSGIGVFQGDETGALNPAQGLTREMAATIVCNMLLGKTVADNLVASGAPFTDVAATDWSAPYIAYCKNTGIVAGRGDGTFGPKDELTNLAFATIMLRALGYKDESEGWTNENVAWGERATMIHTAALRAGLLDDIAVGVNDQLVREDAIQMAFNTLTADMVEYDGVGSIILPGDVILNMNTRRTTVANNTYSYLNSDYTGGAGSTLITNFAGTEQFCERYFPNLKVASGNTELGMPANIWYNSANRTTAVGSPSADQTITTAQSTNVLATYTTNVADVTNADLTRLGLSGSITVKVNNQAASAVTLPGTATDKPFSSYAGATVYVIDNGGTKEIRVVYGYLAQVTKVNDATATRERTVDLKVYNTQAGANVNGYKTETFEKDQWVMVYPKVSLGAAVGSVSNIVEVKPVASADMVSGRLDLVGGTNGSAVSALTLGGVKYNVAASTLAQFAPGNTVAADTYGFDQDYTVFLSNGYVIGVSGEKKTASIGDIVYVTRKAWTATNTYGQSRYFVEVVNMDGTTAIIETATNPAAIATDTDANAAGFYKVDGPANNRTFEALTATVTEGAPYGATALNGAVSMTETTAGVTVDAVTNGSALTRAYITGNTRLLFIGTQTGADLKVTLVTGPMKQSLADNAMVLVSRDGANVVVEAIIIADTLVDETGDVVYVVDRANGANAIGNLYPTYSIVDGARTDLPVKDGAHAAGFSTYSINEKGEYNFKPVAAAADGTNTNGVHALSATTVSVYRGLLSETNGAKILSDIDASNAIFIDLRTPNPENEALSLEFLNGKKVTGQIYVREGKVVAIAVETVATPSAGTAATYVSTEFTTKSTDEYFEVTLGGITVNVASTVTTDANQAKAWSDAYDASSDWTASVVGTTVTLTYKDTGAFTGGEDAAKTSAGITSGSFTDGDNDNAAKFELTLAAAVDATSLVKVTIDGKAYYVAKSNDDAAKQLAAWVAAYTADDGNTLYGAAVGTGENAGKVVLTAKAAGAQGSNNTGMTGGTFTDGTNAD